MYTINKDFADRSWMRVNTKLTRRGSASNLVGVKIVTALLIFVAVISLAAYSRSAKAVNYASSVTGATTDTLMSDEMAEFIVKYAKGADISEQDMD